MYECIQLRYLHRAYVLRMFRIAYAEFSYISIYTHCFSCFSANNKCEFVMGTWTYMQLLLINSIHKPDPYCCIRAVLLKVYTLIQANRNSNETKKIENGK